MFSFEKGISGSMIEVEITIVSAKHLKNVNWRHGDLKPYAVAYLDTDRRSATKPDDAGSTNPVWNERLLLPLPSPLHHDSPLTLTLTLDIFHSKPSETPKPLVGTARSPLNHLIDVGSVTGIPTPIRTLHLHRPSGRPQGKIRIKLSIQDRVDHSLPPPPPPPPSYYYSAPPLPHRPPPPPGYYYSDPYSAYYSAASGYYSATPAYHDRVCGYGVGPSAPLDYSSAAFHEQKQKGSNVRFGGGLAVGAVAGSLGGLALEEGVKHEEGKIAERVVEGDLASREDYNDYRADY